MIRCDRWLHSAHFLAADASVWVHLDETMSHKRFILDDVFGASAYVATVVWQKRLTVESRTISPFPTIRFSFTPRPGQKAWKQSRNRVPGRQASTAMVTPRPFGETRPSPLPGYRSGPAARHHQSSWAPTATRAIVVSDEAGSLIACSRKTGRWTKGGSGQPRMKNFVIDAPQVPGTVDCPRNRNHDDAKRHLASLFPEASSLFDTPKPEKLPGGYCISPRTPGTSSSILRGLHLRQRPSRNKMGAVGSLLKRLVNTVAEVLLPRLNW